MVLEELRALRKEVRQLSLAVRGPQPNPTRPTNVQPLTEPNLVLELDSHPALGNPEAKVVIVEFSDFQMSVLPPI